MSTKKNEIINKINQLTKQIIEHNENYHTYDNPKISDEEYDALYSELKKIENSPDAKLDFLERYFLQVREALAEFNSNSKKEKQKIAEKY